MKRFKCLPVIIILAVSVTGFIQGQVTTGLNPIQTAVPFQIIAPDSRAGAMGDAGAATSPDPYSMHWNPAKYAFIDGKSGFALSYAPWLRALIPDINIAYLSYYQSIDSKQVIAASLVYSSLGEIQFTDPYGEPIKNFKANEFSIDAAYSRLLSEHFSGGVAFRFIYSNLTGGEPVGGTETKPGISYAADISGYYTNETQLSSKDFDYAFGFNFSNIGAKMSYTDTNEDPNFIPMNMRLGTSGTVTLDRYNKISLAFDINKLLVPTPPIVDLDDNNQIIAGKDPNVSVPVAIFQSFYDAPGGFKEEMHELSYAIGTEYIYNEQFALRGGYYHEHASKGNRIYFTAGAGFKLSAFSIDISYLMPLAQNHPLARTLRFSIAFELESLRNASKQGV